MLSKENTFLISGIHFMYKFVIPDTRITQNKSFFLYFFEERKNVNRRITQKGVMTLIILKILLFVLLILKILLLILLFVLKILLILKNYY